MNAIQITDWKTDSLTHKIRTPRSISLSDGNKIVSNDNKIAIM